MSRSYRKKNILPCAVCKSEKGDKKMWHSKYRSKCNQICHTKKMDDDFCANDFPNFREVSNIWNFSKDGKMWIPDDILNDVRYGCSSLHTNKGRICK